MTVTTIIARVEPPLATLLRAARRKLRAHFSRGYELVYEYEAPVFAYGPSLTGGEAVLALQAKPDGVSLFFNYGKSLPDPQKLLRGNARQVRYLVLESAKHLDTAPVRALIKAALGRSSVALKQAPKLTTVLKSASAPKRSRRGRR